VTLTGGAPAGASVIGMSGDARGPAVPRATQAAVEDPKAEGAAGGNAYEAQRTATALDAAGASDRIAVQMTSGKPGRDLTGGDATAVPRPASVAPNRTEAAFIGDGAAAGNGGGAGGDGAESSPVAAAPQPPNPLIAGSLALLGIGLLLFGLRIASRRVR
jgi:hypothetical protein